MLFRTWRTDLVEIDFRAKKQIPEISILHSEFKQQQKRLGTPASRGVGWWAGASSTLGNIAEQGTGACGVTRGKIEV